MDPPQDNAIKLPEPLVLVREREPDELIPAFGNTGRVMRGDLHRLLTEWLQTRLNEAFPGAPPTAWLAQLASWADANNVFFRKSERAVIFALIEQRYIFRRTPIVHCQFLFHRDLGPEGGSQRDSEGERQCLMLLRELRDWSRQLGATEVVGLESSCDIPYSRLHTRFVIEKRDQLALKVV